MVWGWCLARVEAGCWVEMRSHVGDPEELESWESEKVGELGNWDTGKSDGEAIGLEDIR